MKVVDSLGNWRDVPEEVAKASETVRNYMSAHGVRELNGLSMGGGSLPLQGPGFQTVVKDSLPKP